MSLLSIVTYPNIASAQGSFTFSFSYINGTDIDAFVDGVKVFENNASTGTAVGGNTYTVTFSSPGSNTLTFTPNVPAGSDVRIERNTDLTTKEVDFSDGSVLTENALDKAVDQVFFAAQEAIDKTASTITEAPDGKWDAQNKIIKNVADPVNNTDAVNKQFISTNLPNITTVAGISTDVTTVAGISSNVTTVAGNNANVTTVASNIADVNTVATNIADVVTVANDLNEAISEIETAALDLQETTSEIDTVSNSIANVDTVGNNITNVNTVAGISGNVTTVAGNNANVTTVAGISTDVSTVASNNANVTAVAGNATNINTVAGINTDVTTVAGISANVTTVAADQADIGTVATDITNVNAVAGNSANINAVVGNATNINSVAGNATNINTVAGDTTAINTVATNISDVNNFADTYFVSATAPASPTTGDLWFDTTNNTMKVYGGSGFQNAGSSVNGTAQRLTYTATAGQTTFAATYDAGYVDVYLNGVKLINGTDFTATNGTSVVLATGAAVNDTVDIVAYGTFQLSNFSINDANDVNAGGATSGQFLKFDGTNFVADSVPAPTLSTLGIANHDDITVDASGNVGIGTASVDARLHAEVSSGNTIAKFENTVSGSGLGEVIFASPNRPAFRLNFQTSNDSNGFINYDTGAWKIFGNSGGSAAERMRIDSSGRVTKPFNPSFRATSGRSSYSGGGQSFACSSVAHNIGNHYNSTNGRFTAPVAGTYHFSYSTTPLTGANGQGSTSLRVNGSQISQILDYSSADSSTASHTVYLNANDYVEAFGQGANGGTWSVWSSGNQSFSGHLVG